MANFIFCSIQLSSKKGCTNTKSLVVYYSKTGNTKSVAKIIADEIGADIEEIVDQVNRSGFAGRLGASQDAIYDEDTEIAPISKSPADYDLIVVGTPIWANSITPAVRTYLKSNDLSGKKVAAFFAQSTDTVAVLSSKRHQLISKPFPADQIKALVPNSTWIGEFYATFNIFTNKGKREKQVREWSQKLILIASEPENPDDVHLPSF